MIDLWSYWCIGWLYWWLPPPRAKVIFIAEWRARRSQQHEGKSDV